MPASQGASQRSLPAAKRRRFVRKSKRGNKLRNLIRNQILSVAETKILRGNNNFSLKNETPQAWDTFQAIGIGDDNYQRNGDRVQFVSVTFRYRVTFPSDRISNQLRLVLIRIQGDDATASSKFAAAGNSYIHKFILEEHKVIRDKVITHTGNTVYSLDAGSGDMPSRKPHFEFGTMHVKLPKYPTTFGPGGFPIHHRYVFIAVAADNFGGLLDNICFLDVATELRFKDL